MSRAIFDKKYHPLLFHPQYTNIPKKEPGIHIARFFHRSSFRMIRYLFFLLSLNSISCTTANNDRCCKDSNPYADRCIIAGLYRTSCCTAGIVRSSSARCTIIRDRSDPIISTMICSRCSSRNRCRLGRKTVSDLLCYSISVIIIQCNLTLTGNCILKGIIINRISILIRLQNSISNTVDLPDLLEDPPLPEHYHSVSESLPSQASAHRYFQWRTNLHRTYHPQ